MKKTITVRGREVKAVSIIAVALIITSCFGIAAIYADSGPTNYEWKVVWVNIEDSEIPSNIDSSTERAYWKLDVLKAIQYWNLEFGAPLDMGPYYSEEWATYSSCWSFLEAWESGTFRVTTGQYRPVGGRIFMVDGCCYQGDYWNYQVWLGTSKGHEEGCSMFDGGYYWSWSASIVAFLQRRIFTYQDPDGSPIQQRHSDIDAIVRRGFGSAMGMDSCWLGDHIPFYTCLMEHLPGDQYAHVANELCSLCYNWFWNNVAVPRGWR